MAVVLGIVVGAFAVMMIWFLIQYLTPILAAAAGLRPRRSSRHADPSAKNRGCGRFLHSPFSARGAGLFVYGIILAIARELKQTYGRKRPLRLAARNRNPSSARS